MSAWPNYKLSPQMEDDVSNHSWVVLLHDQPQQKTDAVEGTPFPAWAPPHTGFQYICTLFFFFLALKEVNTQLQPGELWCRGHIASSDPISTAQWVTLDMLLDLLSCFSASKLGAKGTPLLKPTQHGAGRRVWGWR